jgi:hypothetical protein
MPSKGELGKWCKERILALYVLPPELVWSRTENINKTVFAGGLLAMQQSNNVLKYITSIFILMLFFCSFVFMDWIQKK